jgi:shikimate kinase
VSHVFLIGFMGAGKSTVGRIVADRFGVPFIDLDSEITRAARRSITEIFDAEGEQGFRSRETAALMQLADTPAAVVACGGGVVLVDENRRLLKETGVVVYLKVSAEEAIARIGDTTGRPLLAHGDAAHMAATLLATRETLYETVADAVVDTSGLTPEQVASSAFDALASIYPEGDPS